MSLLFCKLLSLIKTPKYIIREYFHRRRVNSVQRRFVLDSRCVLVDECVGELNENGIVILQDYFGAEQMARLSNAFDSVVVGKKCKHNPKAYVSDDFFVESSELLEVALDDHLLEMIFGYYGNDFGLARASACRLDPVPDVRKGSFRWHHDARGRQLHVMVLVNDVPSNAQGMTYLRKSHNTYYDHYRGIVKTCFDKEVVGNQGLSGEIVEVFGGAGTVAIFDSNGLHSGNRNDSCRRDALIYCYVSFKKKHFFPLTYRQEDVLSLKGAKKKVLTSNPKHIVV
jgi:hypothetical protein